LFTIRTLIEPELFPVDPPALLLAPPALLAPLLLLLLLLLPLLLLLELPHAASPRAASGKVSPTATNLTLLRVTVSPCLVWWAGLCGGRCRNRPFA
jgi:hypothetical protein